MTTATFILPPDPRSSASAREALRRVMGRWADEEIRADAVLLLAELVANGVRHARSPMTVLLRLNEDLLRVEVRDESASKPVPRDPDEHGGRGFVILDALATTWGVLGHPGAGKTVWFELVGAGALVPA